MNGEDLTQLTVAFPADLMDDSAAEQSPPNASLGEAVRLDQILIESHDRLYYLRKEFYKRLAELQKATSDLKDSFHAAVNLSDSRRAALNLMEDAIQSAEALRKSQAQKVFLLQLSDKLRPLSDPTEIQQAVTQALGQFLEVDRAMYAEIVNDGQSYVITDNYVRGDYPKMIGEGPTSDFGQAAETLRAGQMLVISNCDKDAGLTDEDRAMLHKAGAVATISVPLVKNGNWIANLNVHQDRPRTWTADEVYLLEEVAQRAWAAIERARAERSLVESEEKYRTLFEALDQAYSLIKILYDSEGKPVDYLIVEHNPAFAKYLQIETGKNLTARHITPELDQFWIDTYAQVAKTGESIRFERHEASREQWLDVFAARVGGEGSLLVTVISDNITDRKRREANHALLAEITHGLVGLTNIEETMQLLGSKIGEHFKVSHCLFPEITEDQETTIVNYEWHRADFSTLKGRYRLRDFYSDEYIETHSAGEVSVINDTANDPRTNAQNYARFGIYSLMNVPLKRDGKWQFMLCLLDSKPRIWREDEIELIRELAGRIWTRLERARAEQALRESEERLRIAVEAAEMATWAWDLQTNDIVWNERHFLLFGLEPSEQPQRPETFFNYVYHEDQDWVGIRLNQAIETDTTFEAEFRIVRADGVIRWMEGYGHIVETIDGKASRMVGVMSDITERKNAEEAQLQAQAELERRVRERTSDLYQANAILQTEISKRIEIEEERQRLLRRIVALQEEERRRISRELHDNFGQQLTALRLGVDSILRSDGQRVSAEAEIVQDIIKRLDTGVDFMARELRPAALDELGLATTIANFVEEWSSLFKIPADFHTNRLTNDRLPFEIEINLYRIVQETLNNISKHAHATQVAVILEWRENHVILIVEDNGIGFATQDRPAQNPADKGLGLIGMRERAMLIGGKLEIESSRENGTTIFVRVPLSLPD